MIESCSHPARSFGKRCRQSSDLARRIRFGLGVVQGVLAEVEGLFVDRLCEDVGTHPFGRDKERLDDELHYRVLDQGRRPLKIPRQLRRARLLDQLVGGRVVAQDSSGPHHRSPCVLAQHSPERHALGCP